MPDQPQRGSRGPHLPHVLPRACHWASGREAWGRFHKLTSPSARCAGHAQPTVQGRVGAGAPRASLPPPRSTSSLQHFRSWEGLGPAAHSLPSAQDEEAVVPTWPGASVATWGTDFEQRRPVHVRHPLRSSWWGFLPRIPVCSPLSAAEAQGSDSFLVALNPPRARLQWTRGHIPFPSLCRDSGGPSAGSVMQIPPVKSERLLLPCGPQEHPESRQPHPSTKSRP